MKWNLFCLAHFIRTNNPKNDTLTTIMKKEPTLTLNMSNVSRMQPSPPIPTRNHYPTPRKEMGSADFSHVTQDCRRLKKFHDILSLFNFEVVYSLK